jgi:hypothetical protein
VRALTAIFLTFFAQAAAAQLVRGIALGEERDVTIVSTGTATTFAVGVTSDGATHRPRRPSGEEGTARH